MFILSDAPSLYSYHNLCAFQPSLSRCNPSAARGTWLTWVFDDIWISSSGLVWLVRSWIIIHVALMKCLLVWVLFLQFGLLMSVWFNELSWFQLFRPSYMGYFVIAIFLSDLLFLLLVVSLRFSFSSIRCASCFIL